MYSQIIQLRTQKLNWIKVQNSPQWRFLNDSGKKFDVLALIWLAPINTLPNLNTLSIFSLPITFACQVFNLTIILFFFILPVEHRSNIRVLKISYEILRGPPTPTIKKHLEIFRQACFIFKHVLNTFFYHIFCHFLYRFPW